MGTANFRVEPPLGGTTVGTAETTLAWRGGNSTFTTLDLGHKQIQQLALRIANTHATIALATLKVYGKFTGSDSWRLLASTRADFEEDANPYVLSSVVYTTATGTLVDHDPTSIVALDSAILHLRTAGLQSLKVTTTAASAGCTVEAWAHGDSFSTVLGSPLPVVPSSGLPTQGTDVAGADTYVTVVTAPNRVTHYMLVQVSTKGAIVSLDGGTTGHFTIPLDSQWLFEGLSIPAGAVIQAKNQTAGQNYANIFISVW